jgi:KipI family sensor histidine kinase inhibitor
VHYDPVAWATGADAPGAAIAQALGARVSATADVVVAPGRLVEIPVRYGGADGPDLGEVAAHAGLTESQVVVLHASVEYDVYMVGFSPGFPYLAGLPERLAMPRRATPRVRVPAGSVAIGGLQTGVYPLASPGGWRLIGRTPLPLFDPRREPPVLLSLGDRVRFVPVEA